MSSLITRLKSLSKDSATGSVSSAECMPINYEAGRAAGIPRISVVTVVRNGVQVLEKAIRSVVEQGYEGLEYIVIDGGSDDGTVALIERYADRIAYWVSEPDAGIYDAMNKAMAVASGNWLLFLGADDELKLSLHALAPSLKDRGAVYYGDVERVYAADVRGGRFHRYRLMQENICHQAIFYPRAVYQTKRYALDSGILADHKYNIELWGTGTRFVHLPVVVSRFNDAGASSGNNTSFEPIKLAAIRQSFGPMFYVLKRLRTALVRLLKGPA